MKSFSLQTVADKNKIHSDAAFLIALNIKVVDPDTGTQVETLHLIHNNEDISYQGNIYVATPFEIQFGQESGAAPEMNLSIPDYSRAIQARMQAYGGGVGFEVDVMIINSNNLLQEPENVEWFEIVGASASEYEVKWQLGTSNPLASPFPRRRQFRNRCSWRFGSSECNYSPTPGQVCDLSLQGPNGCASKGNEINFGGFPGLGRGFRYG